MANKRYSDTKASQASKDTCYEGETGKTASRDTTGAFGDKIMVNDMKGTGAAKPYQAQYTVPKDNWRSK